MFSWLVGDWRTIGFVVMTTALIYLSALGALRLGERRTLTETTAYDFVVAIALGSIIGRTATSPRPSYVHGMSAIATLLLCHHALSWLRIRSPFVRRLADRAPVELVRHGEVDAVALRRAHLTLPDLEMVVREHGLRSVEDADLVVLESRGAFSVITDTETNPKQSRS